MKRIISIMAVGAVLLTMVAGVAVAADFQCKDVPCIGTIQEDQITEREGSVRDVIEGRNRDDVISAALFGKDDDKISGDTGDDRLNANDGDGRDIIDGGPGKDTCIGDRGDRFKSCEDIRRK